MNESEIISVWGTADNYELTFVKNGSTWDVTVPPDLSDGTYACEIFAKNEYHRIAHWTGFLYMHYGRAYLHLNKPRFVFWFACPQTSLQFMDKRINLRYEGGCICGRTV